MLTIEKQLVEPILNHTKLSHAEARQRALELMRQVVYEQKKTLVMVTHDNGLASYADRVFHISDGKIVKIEGGNEV